MGCEDGMGCGDAGRLHRVQLYLSYSPILDALAIHPDHNAVIAAFFIAAQPSPAIGVA